MEAQMKVCNKCGKTGVFKSRTHHAWNAEKKQMGYCGTYRILPGHFTEAQLQRQRNGHHQYGKRKGKPRYEKWRRCNNCGHTAWVLNNNHTPNGIYCGYMRVIRNAINNPDMEPGPDVR